MNDTAARLSQCFATVFPGLASPEISAASINSVEQWDSVATVTLLSVVGEEFGIDIDFDRFEDLTSFEGLLHYVEESRQA
jgi:acyl carrier protein